MRKSSFSLFDLINNFVLLIVGLVCIIPFLHIFAMSTSDGLRAAAGEVYFWPKQFNIETYKYILGNPRLNIFGGLLNSFSYMIVGTVVAVILTYMTAYALSRKRLRYRYVIMLVFLFTWIFEAGIIPNYLVYRALGMVNSFWVMVIPLAVNTFLLIVTRSFLDTLPDELEESAFIDGANEFHIMSQIYLPLSKPVLATISVFYAVNIWNMFLIPLIYLQDSSLHPIQLVLYHLIIDQDPQSLSFENMIRNDVHLMPHNIRAAAIFVAVFPILFIYPYAQKYFTKGFLIGSIKG